MILKYTPLIKYIAQRLAMRLPPHIAAEDLIGAGVIGLMDALDKFDPSKKVKFKTYAEIRIKGAMLDELRSLDWVSRSVRQKSAQLEKTLHLMEKKKGRAVEDEEVAQEMGLSLDDYYSMLNDVRGVMLLDMERLRKKSPDLPEDELFEIPMEGEENQLHYFFNQMELRDVLAWAIKELTPNEKTVISLYYFEQLTLKEIGEVLGYTESRICQIHTKAILKLRSKLKNLKKDTNPKVFVPHI
ncbi:MAG: FliA/WhiG family RNA polymerase sigma factor [Candidatus Nealsonbacteria bacterium]|nr:FliA/WhiG family RNA polymerase sigma factor [Candidatus Nealsonbacteria bacterium]